MATAFLDRVVNKAIGEMLIEKGTVSAEQVEEALACSRSEGIRLGEALLRLGYVTQDALNYALGEQYGMRPMELHPSMLDERLVRRFPLDLLERHLMIPLIEMGNEVVVVVSDPNKTEGLEEMKRLVPGVALLPQLADEDQIRRCLETLSRSAYKAGRSAAFTTGFIEVSAADSEEQKEVPPANSPEFTDWLLSTCLENAERDLLLRPLGNECQVTSSGPMMEEKHRFSLGLFPAVRDNLWKNCIALEQTAASVGRWHRQLRSNGQLYDLLVLSSVGGEGESLRLRSLRHAPPRSAPTRVPAAFPKISPGACTVVLYDDRSELETYLEELLLQYGPGNVFVLAQQATRCSLENAVVLPAGYADITSSAIKAGATCVLYDYPVTALELLRVLRSSFDPPAVVVCAPVVPDASGAFGISPDIDEIRTRLKPELVTLRAGAASHHGPAADERGDL